MALPPLLGLLCGSFAVTGTSTCPSPADVEQQLKEILPEDPSGGVGDLALVGDTLRVRLLDPAGGTLAERRLPVQGSCSTLATVAALALVALVDEFPSQAPPAPSRLPVLSNRLPEDTGEPPARWGGEISLGLLGFSTQGGAAAGGVLGLSLGWGRTPWRLVAMLFGDLDRTIFLSPGSSRWQRTALGLGPSYALTQEHSLVRIELQGLATVALLTASVSGFSENPSVDLLDPGVSLVARMSLPLGRWVPWLGVWGTGYLWRHSIELGNLVTPETIPSFALFSGLGVSLRLESSSH